MAALYSRLAPEPGETHVGNRADKGVVFHHALDIQVFNANGVKASRQVGYASASQCAREYKRQFGASPRSHTQSLPAAFA